MTQQRGRGFTRREVLRMAGAGAAVASLSTVTGCVTGGSGGQAPAGGGGSVTLTSSLVDPNSRAAMEKLIADFKATGGDAVLNTLPGETFEAQLPTYLDSDDPPNVMVYFAGAITQRYGDRGKLLDVSDVWRDKFAHFPESLRKLSTDSKGQQVFVPTNYYWWSMFYRREVFDKLGVQPAKTWEEFLDLCAEIRKGGIYPIVTGAGKQPWPLIGWFDYLDLRINGAAFHRELLTGKHAFDGPEVREVFAELAKVVPYIDPASRSYAYQEAITPLAVGKAGMYLMGALITDALPPSVDDLDFFQFPILDPSVPIAEEAPTNGFIAPAKARNVEDTKALLAFLGSDAAQVTYCQTSKSSSIPTSPTADTSWTADLVRKGLDLLGTADDLTQFFNRDSSEALQQTGYTACTKFLADPGSVDDILKEWQTAAAKVFAQQGE